MVRWMMTEAFNYEIIITEERLKTIPTLSSRGYLFLVHNYLNPPISKELTKLKISRFPGFLWKIVPRQTPKGTSFPEKMETPFAFEMKPLMNHTNSQITVFTTFMCSIKVNVYIVSIVKSTG